MTQPTPTQGDGAPAPATQGAPTAQPTPPGASPTSGTSATMSPGPESLPVTGVSSGSTLLLIGAVVLLVIGVMLVTYSRSSRMRRH